MERIVVGETGWADIDVKADPGKLVKISEQMLSVSEMFDAHRLPSECDIKTLFDNISDALHKWTGSTYVGVKKNKKLENAYKTFFDAFYKLLTCFAQADEKYRKIADRILFNGTLYRYLGHSSCDKEYDSRIEPKYNGVWVSWSKDDVRSIPYLNMKLYGTKTLLICETGNPKGIDLSGWDEIFNTNIVRPSESEVVYPTIKESMINVIYLDEDREDNEDE